MKKLAWVLLGVLLAAWAHTGFSDPSTWTAVKQPNGQYVCRRDSDGTKLKQDYSGKANATQACNGMTWLERELFGTAFALPIPLSPVPTQAGVVNTKCRTDGSCDPAPATLTCADNSGQASMSGLQTGNSYSADVGTYFSGTGKATATYSIVTASGDDAAANGWALSGTIGTTLNLVNNGMDSDLPGSGSLKVRGTLSGNNVDCGALNWSYVSPPTTDTTAPNPVSGTTSPSQTSTTVTLEFDSTIDPSGTVQRSGVASYDIYRNGVMIDSLTAPTPGLVNDYTCGNIGSVTGSTSHSQSGAQHTVTGGGAGTEGAADSFYACGMSVTGSSVDIVARISSLPNAATYNKAVLELAGSNNADAIVASCQLLYETDVMPAEFYAAARNRSTVGGVRTSPAGTTLIGTSALPAYMHIHHDTSGQDCEYSLAGGPWIPVLSDFAIALPNTKIGRFGSTATSNGVTIPVVFDYVSVYVNGRLTKTVTPGAGSATFTVRAKDVDGNLAAALAGVTVAPTAPPVTNAIKWHPGNYMQVGRSFSDSIGTCTDAPITTACKNAATATRFAYYDAIGSISQIQGVNFDVPWTLLEGAQGDYTAGIALMQAEFAKLKSLAQPKRLSIRIYTEHYGAPGTYFKVFPTYLSAAGCIVSNTAGNLTIFKLWDVTCRGYYLSMIQAYAFLDADPMFETFIVLGETSITDPTSMSGYTAAGTNNAYRVMAAAARAAYPHANVSMYNNWLDSGKPDVDSLMAYQASIGVATGAPDSSPTVGDWGYAAYRGTLTGASVDYRGVIPWITGIEASELGTGAQPTYKPLTIWTWLNTTMHGSHFAWDRQNYTSNCNYVKADGTSDGSDASCTLTKWGTVGSGGLLDFLIAHPTPTFTACPTRYDTLFGNGSAGSGCDTN